MALEKLRLDKYLWAIRVYKTRSLATDACNRGKILLNNQRVKPAHPVKIGEIYHVRIDKDYIRIIEVKELLEKRNAFSFVKDFFAEHSLPREKKETQRTAFILPQGKREKGSGRPTKKDRRNLGDAGLL